MNTTSEEPRESTDSCGDPSQTQLRQHWPNHVYFLIATLAFYTLITALAKDGRRNKISALTALRTITDAQSTFRKTDHDGIFRYGDLQDLAQAGLIDAELASGTKDGYLFKIVPGNNDKTNSEYVWFATADPESGGNQDEKFLGATQGDLFHKQGSPIIFEGYINIALDAHLY